MAPPARGRFTSSHVVFACLGALIVAGIALRVVASFAWWPIATSLPDAWPYSSHAALSPFDDPQHPPGYSTYLKAIGIVTREPAVFTVLQHALSVAAAVLLFLAVRRLCGSPWPGLVGAATILLGADQIYLEHAVSSEALFVPLLVLALYAVARALDQPDRWWPWMPIAGALLVVAACTRSAGYFMLPVVALAVVLARPRPWTARWKPIVAFVGTATVLVLAYGGANVISHDKFELSTAGGWHLYGRVAPFAWCGDFTPPKGTEDLCETSDPATRPGTDWYLYDPASPSVRKYGYVAAGSEADEQLGAFARAAVLGQPKTFLKAVWTDIKAYWFPDSYVWSLGRGGDIDGQLNWTTPPNVEGERATERGMRTFFDRFTVTRDWSLLGFLHDYQRKARFGGALLCISTALIALGLLVGSRRSRIAVLVLGVGGIAMIALPSVSIIYIGRYTVPPASLITSGAAVAAVALVGAARARMQARPGRREQTLVAR